MLFLISVDSTVPDSQYTRKVVKKEKRRHTVPTSTSGKEKEKEPNKQYALLTTTHNKNRDDVHLKTILVLASNKQAQLLCGVSRVVPKDQLLLAKKTSALGYVTTVSVHSALRLTGPLTDFEH